MREVVAKVEALTIDNLNVDKGYVMEGKKGDFIIARDTLGKYIWVRLTPSKTTAKAVKAYDSLREAIKDKLDHGYRVFEYTDVELQ